MRDDDDELLGFVTQEISGWSAQTIFGYVIARAADREAAEMVVQRDGLAALKGMWRYYDEQDGDWFPCILKNVYENRVIVIRTNELGFQEPESYKLVTINDPNDTVLLKA